MSVDGEAVDQPVPPPSASGHKEGLNTITQEQAKETHAAGQKSSLASGPEAAAGGGWGQPSTHGDVAGKLLNLYAF